MNFLQMLCCALAVKSGELIDGYNSVIGARQLRGARRAQTWEETNVFLQSAAEEITETGKNICECPQETVRATPVYDGRLLRVSWNKRVYTSVLANNPSQQ
jgi:hypothetical protein